MARLPWDVNPVLYSEVEPAPECYQDRPKPQEQELEQVELQPGRPIFLSSALSSNERAELLCLLTEYIDVFAWEYSHMPGLATTVTTHRLNINPGARPVKQASRVFRTEIELQIKEEISKLLYAGFLKPTERPVWLANVVPVRKKNGQIRICVDFRDLNRACPKDDFPLPSIDLLIDATAGHQMFSFMDGFCGYNQIKMDPEDALYTAFRTPIGVFYYTVMPFGLKNTGATYHAR